ncbi:hypothetical protein [Croceicoccus sediminis]|uniref:hypothetical protein n=1 Tax=Croceicoccus sediminis TaxID=2571150 RepID=UPI001182F145|nr:hypothetical protein [Croceicoccus sediminis]
MPQPDAMTVMQRESRVRHGVVDPVIGGEEVAAGFNRIEGDEFVLRDEGFACRYRKGEGITVQLDDPTKAGLLDLFLAGSIHSAVAAINGYTALHASAVEVDGKAIAFTGPPGAGKSTTAAAMRARGLAIVADDTLVVDMAGPHPMCLPGHKRLKLWPDSVAMTGTPAFEQVSEDYPKIFAAEEPSEIDMPLPLGAIVTVEAGDELAFDPVRGAARIAVLDDDHYTAQHRVMAQGQDRARRLTDLARLANAVPVYRFVRPLDAGRFGPTHDFLAAQLARIEQDTR